MNEFIEWLNAEIKDCTANESNMYYAGRYSEAIRIRAKLTDTFNEISEKICDHYCRFPEGYGDKEDDKDRMWIERCQFCPLNKL